MKIKIVANLFGQYHRQDVAVDSWRHLKTLYPDIEIVNYQFKDEEEGFVNPYPDITTKFELHDYCKKFVINSTRKLPQVDELLEWAFSVPEESDYIILTNSDVIIQPALIEHIIKNQPNAMAVSRVDIEDVESHQEIIDKKVKPVRYETFGSDTFVFKTTWIELNYPLFRGSYFMGMWRWDNVYAGLIKMLNPETPLGVYFPAFAFHIHHGLASVMTDCPEKDWNEDCLKNYPLHQTAFNIMSIYLNNYMLKRPDAPTFLQLAPNELETELAFFKQFKIHEIRQEL